VIQRRTQTAQYWEEEFDLSDKDAAYLYGTILDGAKPVSTAFLAETLIGRHCRQEEELIQAELSKGSVYQPKDVYEVGEPIIFPLFGYALGTVVGTRPGRSPDYGDFTVIEVEFEDEEGSREFASGLQGKHRLNRGEGVQEMLAAAELCPPSELYKKYGAAFEGKLVSFLEQHNDFIRFGDDWYLKDLLVEINVGHLHIAEALIEVKSMPLPPEELLSELDLPAEVPEAIQLLSVNSALDVDPRFDNVGDSGRDTWYLRRLTPRDVWEPPKRLAMEVTPYNRQDIAEELLLIEREIDDEGSGQEVMGPSRPLYRTTIALIYPHWRCGTLPLTVRTRSLFPESTNRHSPVVLVDGQSGDRMQGWVVHEKSFVYGLDSWYKKYRLPVGAFVKLERTRDPRVITVDFEARRLKNLWTKAASVQGGKLVFQVRKTPIACDYDDQMTISEDNVRALDRLWDEVHSKGESLLQTMIRILPELIRLSPQGTVHAKTIYSAVNILRRTPPGPTFALLSTEPCFVPMGGGYWTFDEALVQAQK
jgi:hypothetical protein